MLTHRHYIPSHVSNRALHRPFTHRTPFDCRLPMTGGGILGSDTIVNKVNCAKLRERMEEKMTPRQCSCIIALSEPLAALALVMWLQTQLLSLQMWGGQLEVAPTCTLCSQLYAALPHIIHLICIAWRLYTCQNHTGWQPRLPCHFNCILSGALRNRKGTRSVKVRKLEREERDV